MPRRSAVVRDNGGMDEETATQVVDRLRERGVMAHVAHTGVYRAGIRVVLADGREAVWDADGSAALDAEVLRDGVLVGFVPAIPGSEDFDTDAVIEAIATVDYDDPAHSDPGSVGVAERAPTGERGGLEETRPRTGGPTDKRHPARFGRRLRGQ